jgi:hypothetical protein
VSRRFIAGPGVELLVQAVFATRLAKALRREGTLGRIELRPITNAVRATARAEAAANSAELRGKAL